MLRSKIKVAKEVVLYFSIGIETPEIGISTIECEGNSQKSNLRVNKQLKK